MNTQEKNVLHVGYLAAVDRTSEEEAAALAWLSEEATDVRVVRVGLTRRVEAFDVLWVHFPDEATYEAFRPNTPLCAALRTYVEQGGRLLLTNFAAYLPHDLGLETKRPEAQPRVITDEGFGRTFGFQSFRGHPLLRDCLNSGSAGERDEISSGFVADFEARALRAEKAGAKTPKDRARSPESRI